MSGAILIVARNNLALTKKAVKSAMNQTLPCDVLVVDNCSIDGTVDWLKTKNIAARTYLRQVSLATCWNDGIRVLMRAGYDKVLVLNNDVEIPPHFYAALDDTDFPFVTGVSVNSKDQCPQTLTRGTGLLEMEARPHPDFSAFMISLDVVEKVGWFNEDYYPAYCEDCDYHIRMHRAGIRAVCIDVPFYHAAAQTLKQAGATETSRIQRGADANRERFRRQYGCLPGTPEYEKLFA